MCFNFKDFLNADANCPGYVIMAFEMIEMLKNQGSKGTLNIFIKSVNQSLLRKLFQVKCQNQNQSIPTYWLLTKLTITRR